MKLATWIGAISFLLDIWPHLCVLRALIVGGSVAGWASLVSIVLLLGGIQLFCLGLLGNYISKIYLETKHRPKYIIKEQNRGEMLDNLKSLWVNTMTSLLTFSLAALQRLSTSLFSTFAIT